MNSFMKIIIILMIYFVGRVAFAAGGEFPGFFITKQFINFGIFAFLLVFLTKNFIRSHFASREEQFTQHLRKAEAAKEEAESKQRQMRERLSKLEESANSSLDQAKAEAEELKHKLIADAETLSKKMEEEARRSAKVEYEKAMNHLREELMQNSVSLAEQTLRDKVDSKEQKRLQNEFVEKIQVVQ